MLDLLGTATTTAYTSAAITPPTQLELEGLREAINMMESSLRAQETALRRLFELHGYDLANGDVLFRAADVCMNVPPRFASQVRVHPMLSDGAMYFMRNPAFSLF